MARPRATIPALRHFDQVPDSSSSYAERAEEYRRLATETDDPVIAACLVELATQYERLAQGLEVTDCLPDD
jgi:hypothetical protein